MATMVETRHAVAGLAVIPPVSVADFADPAWIGPFAQEAERLGFESLVLPEHVVLAVDYSSRYPYSKSGRVPLPPDCVIPDPIDTLAYVAGVTTTLGLATGLLVLPWHHPLALAKRAATVDRLSGGRLRLGVGLGWMREEIEAGGVDFDSRGERADETIDAMRAVWSADPDAGARVRRTVLLVPRGAVVPASRATRRRADRSGRDEPAGHPPRRAPRGRLALARAAG